MWKFSRFLIAIILLPGGSAAAQTTQTALDATSCSGKWFGYFQSHETTPRYSLVSVRLDCDGKTVVWSMETPTGSTVAPITETRVPLESSSPPDVGECHIPALGKVTFRPISAAVPRLVLHVESPSGDAIIALFRREVKDINHPPHYQLEGPRGYVDTKELTLKRRGIVLGGTLFIPHGKPPFPAIIMASGFTTAKPLHDRLLDQVYISALCEAGVAAFAYDDPGSGRSTGKLDDFTLRESARQLGDWSDELGSTNLVARDQIGFAGMDGGAIVAALAAEEDPDARCLIYISGPHDMEWMMCRQWLTAQSRVLGDDPAEAPLAGRVLIELAKLAATDDTSRPDEAAAAATELIEKCHLQPLGTESQVTDLLKVTYRELRQNVRAASYFSNDPVDILRTLGNRKVPVLVIAGARDKIVPVNTVLRSVRELAATPDIKFFMPDIAHSTADAGDVFGPNPFDPGQLVSPRVLKRASDFVETTFPKAKNP
jgi:pimeloyl-ACP methyl ester carboxylesterase